MTPLEIGLMVCLVIVFMGYGGCAEDRERKARAVDMAIQSFADINELADMKGDNAIKLVSEMSRRMVERTSKGEKDDQKKT